MKRLVGYATVAAVCLLAGRLSTRVLREQVTTTRLSPDELLRAVLVEYPYPGFIDRNFQVRIEEVKGASRTIFRSPDEGRPTGSERFLWSRDGSRLVLLGKHFYVTEGVRLQNGEFLYLLYDFPTGRLWCNADQSRAPRFGESELRGYDFGEPLVLTKAKGGLQGSSDPVPGVSIRSSVRPMSGGGGL
jgi:hypothetical protein